MYVYIHFKVELFVNEYDKNSEKGIPSHGPGDKVWNEKVYTRYRPIRGCLR